MFVFVCFTGCEGQIFVGNDCMSGFYCSDRTNAGTDGCSMTCGPGERINFDLAADVMECVPDDGDYVCPGAWYLKTCSSTFSNGFFYATYTI